MILKSFHMPPWMDEELRMLSFKTKINRADLMRRMINTGLEGSWDRYAQGVNGVPDIIAKEIPKRNNASKSALRALGMLTHADTEAEDNSSPQLEVAEQ